MKFGFDLDLNPKYDVDNQQQKDFYDNSNKDKLIKLADLYYKNESTQIYLEKKRHI